MTGPRLDTIVIGASLAGSAAALVLARSGARVAVVDKAVFPRPKTCGELFSPDGVAALARLGLDGEVRAAGAATIRCFALVRPDGGRVRGRLPAPALSLSRERLDALVLEGARRAGATVHLGEAVMSIEGSLAEGFTVKTPARTLEARTVLGAWGRYSPLDGRLGRPFFGAPATLFGFKKFLAGGAGSRLDDTVVLHVFRGGYLGLSLVEGGRVSLGALATPAVAQEAHHDFDRLLARLSAESPALAADLAGLAPEPGPALVSEPVHLGARGAAWGDVLLAGDAAGVVDPYTGSGMALALRTGEAVGALLAEHAAGRVAAGTLVSEWARRWGGITGSVFFFSRLFRPVFLGGFATRLVVPATAPLAGLAARLTRGSV
ncbi:MAG TPA: FAD-dependent monooxygenase [Thermoanaerobaculia bacterium]|nr:FAD-dependent monooxygenase [Thermoanaerobaculia bacterium]